jgi:hypothetical protein
MLHFPTELVLPHIVGKPVQEYSAEEGMLSPANDVLLKVVDPHELSDRARDERFERLEWHAGRLRLQCKRVTEQESGKA